MICLKQTLMDLKEVGRSPANSHIHTPIGFKESKKREEEKNKEKGWEALSRKRDTYEIDDDEFFMSFVGFLMPSLCGFS